MSRYLVDKFLYLVDRDERLLEQYMEDPATFVARWEEEERLLRSPALSSREMERFAQHNRNHILQRETDQFH